MVGRYRYLGYAAVLAAGMAAWAGAPAPAAAGDLPIQLAAAEDATVFARQAPLSAGELNKTRALGAEEAKGAGDVGDLAVILWDESGRNGGQGAGASYDNGGGSSVTSSIVGRAY